jgi:hypothetical protein
MERNRSRNGVIFISANGSGICVVSLSRNLKLTTTLDRAITQNPCYVPLNLENNVKIN